MARKVYAAFLLLFVVLGLFAVGAWVHSHRDGWEHTWSDPASQQGGRIVSSRGQFVVQRCDLTPDAVLVVPHILSQEATVEMPKDFSVGSNPEGERTVITISGFPVPFAWPETGTFIGRASHTEFKSDFKIQPNGVVKAQRWNASWYEWVIAWWLVTLLLVLVPLCEGMRRLFRLRRREPGESPSVAG